ncbi:MAG: 2'-5' RNA ligase family protein [Pseudonocardiaceae bacterium]
MDLVRVDFALIPADPLFRSVISASQAITDEYYYNENVIDDKEFPPHLSLHICTVPHDRIQQIVDDLRVLIERIDLPDINPVSIEASYGGYVMLNVERTAELMALHEAILDLAAAAREGVGNDKYGSEYIRDSFVPHVSLAKVDRRDVNSATDLGRRVLGDCHPTRTRAFDLCDIGSRSERWDVLASFPGGEPPTL